MTRAENYAELLSGSRTLREYWGALTSANAECLSILFEEFNDPMGQPLSCAIAMEFPDGSKLLRDEKSQSPLKPWTAQ